jgi:dipeptidyl aminopeptidase/acylaminoacyl peptidase
VPQNRLANFALAFALVALACSRERATRPAPYDAGFRGPGRLVLLFENADPSVPRVLVVHDRDGARALAVDDARGARWISSHALLVSQELPPEEEYGLPRTQLLRVDLDSGAIEPFAPPARWFDAEPDPRGERLAAGVEVDDQGASELVLLSLATRGEKPLADSPRALDRPRWSPDGAALVVLQTVPDPDGVDSETGMSFGGQEVAFPRLYRVSADLTGKLSLLRDGEPGGPLTPGGSLPLWWDERGVYARQRRGLVLCDPSGAGCRVVFAPGGERRVFEGRAAGRDEALLLVRDHSEQSDVELPQELFRVRLDSGNGESIYRAPRDVFLSDIDWVAGP